MKQKWIAFILIILFWCVSGCTDLHRASSHGDYELVRELIGSGAQVNQRDAEGRTPLMIAAAENDLQVVEALIFNGADVHLKDNSGKSALWRAYDNDGFEVFRKLLESGARIDFSFDSKSAATVPKMKMIRLAREYTLFKRIQNAPADVPLSAFDAYFTAYPNGVYRNQVENQLKKRIEGDFRSIRYSNSIKELESFLNRYRELGRNQYVVTANTLNVRARSSIDSKIVGEYKRGDRVYAKENQFGWLRTDKGWISGIYAKRIVEPISVIRPYILSVSHKVKGLKEKESRKVKVKRPLPRTRSKPEALETVSAESRRETGEQSAKPDSSGDMKPASGEPEQSAGPESEFDISNIEIENPVASAQKELDKILENPTQEKLKAFIKKYGKDPELHSVVNKARDHYFPLLMGE